MSAHASEGSLAARLSHLYGSLRNCFTASEFEKLDSTIQAQIAADLALSREKLLELSHKPIDSAAEMEIMMRALHIDPAEVRLQSPAQFRDMQTNCSLCGQKDSCRKDLAAGITEVALATYCQNRDELNVLRAQPHLLAD